LEDLESVAEPFVKRTLACIDAALRDAHLRSSDLDRVILVGGSSRIPLVGQSVSEHLERPVLMDENVDKAVALGAAMLAGRASGQQVADVLVDITPHTLACGAVGESGPPVDDEDLHAVAVIPRNTVVPVERARTLYTLMEDQPAVEIPVVQGEASTVGENTWLGLVRIEDLPASPALSPVELTFRLDLSGVLTARAKHIPSGLDAKVTFANSPYHLTAQRREAQRSEVAALRDVSANDSAPATEASDSDRKLADALIKRAQRSLAQAEGVDATARKKVEAAVSNLSEALAGRGKDVATLIDALSDALLDLA
jgi:molecular chaperone DnaK